MSALRHLDVDEVSARAHKEARNRETHLPPVSVYRWWARRTRAVNEAILEAVEREQGAPLTVLDPFAGGGVIPMVAALRGHDVVAQDVDPWAAAGLRGVARLGGVGELSDAAAVVEEELAPLLARAYATRFEDGAPAEVAHTLRVATASCGACGAELSLFPHALLSLLRRKERGGDDAWLACTRGHVFRGSATSTTACARCEERVEPRAIYQRGRVVTCAGCGARAPLSSWAEGGLAYRVALVERAGGGRRELVVPRDDERAQADADGYAPRRSLGDIPAGVETSVLTRHGFRRLEDLYPARQRAVLEALLDAVERAPGSEDTRAALRLAALGTTEMAGHLSRWDRFYLKAYEAMAGHRFNFTTLPVEPHVRGCREAGRGTWRRRLRQLERAARWWREHVPAGARVRVSAGSSESLPVAAGSVDLALTDPPYHDDVAYSELSLPLRAWAGLDTTLDERGATARRGARDGYADALARIFTEVRRTLRADGRLIFSYANREPAAWVALLDALERAGFAGAAFAVVHSENERDASKRGVRACTRDVLLELVPAGAGAGAGAAAAPVSPAPGGDDDEQAYCRAVGAWVLRVGALPEGWRGALTAELSAHPFLARSAGA